jgi:upstream-binding transcription factor
MMKAGPAPGVAETQTADPSNAKKKRRKRDPNAPKKPKLPRDLYVETKLAKIKRQNPSFSRKEAVAHAKQMYDDLTEEAREKYVLEAKELGERFAEELAEYVANNAQPANQDGERTGKKKKKRKRLARDPDRPKVPQSSYFLFQQAYIKRLRESCPGLTQQEYVAKAAAEWNQRNATSKQKYVDRAAALRAQYEIDMKEYNLTHPAELVDADEELGERSEKVRNVKKERDPEQPRQPLSSYLLFVAKRREELAGAENPLSPKELLRALGDEWNALSEKRKQKYKRRADALRAQYKIDMDEYRSTHPELAVTKHVKSEFDWPAPQASKTARAAFMADMMKVSLEEHSSEAECRTALAEQWKSFSKAEQKVWKDKAALAHEAHEKQACRQMGRLSDEALADKIVEMMRVKTGVRKLPFRLRLEWIGERPGQAAALEEAPEEEERTEPLAKKMRPAPKEIEAPDVPVPNVTWGEMKNSDGLLTFVEPASEDGRDVEAEACSRWCVTSSRDRLYAIDSKTSRKISKAYRAFLAADGTAPLYEVASSIGDLQLDFSIMTMSPPFPALKLSKEDLYRLEDGGFRKV